MDTQTIQRLRQLDNDFYRNHAASFSQTRQHAWPGWERVLASLPRNPNTVLDVACGNARFKSFINKRFGDGAVQYYGVDSCSELLPSSQDISFQELDIIAELMEGTFNASVQAPVCDLTVCFGFMHHVPTLELRMRLLEALVEKMASGGLLALSFWRFADDPQMREKARSVTEKGCAEFGITLEEGDYLLGWNDIEGAYRYCHSFTDKELDYFVSRCATSAKLVDCFDADGRTGKMNGYLVLRKLV